MQRLTGLDAAFLALETPSTHMHVMATMVLDPSDTPGGFTVDTMRRLIADRLPRLEPFRRRVVDIPFGVHHPVWIEDPDFDLDYHVRRAALPAPGGMNELAELTAEIAGRQLDRRRPLWELWVVEGLEHGHVAIIAKMHHAAIDGVLGVDLMTEIFDLEPNPQPKPREELPKPERLPSDAELLVGAMTSIARQPLRTVRAVRNLARSATRVVQRIRAQPVNAGVPLTAPPTPLNGVLTPHRRVTFASVPLADIKDVKRAFGVTVNDVVLAVCAGALRRFLDARGNVPDKPLLAAIPASVRGRDERGVMGNRVSAMFATLATQLDDPVDRLFAARDVMSGAKQVHEDIGGNTLHEWAEVAAPVMFSRGMRLYERLVQGRHPPIVNLIVSNVPGPSFPLYC
ncbi:MAG: wax ester/triacylglycerol synthase family O-acyltransferase, partial [Actinomycetota bacterium]|nr:wax ester/triacylglycerol synthase family O-acyltransferase [Actinomycetota bacterium]